MRSIHLVGIESYIRFRNEKFMDLDICVAGAYIFQKESPKSIL